MYYYVELTKTSGEDFVKILEKKGFTLRANIDRAFFYEYGLPFIIDSDRKSISILNVTCAIWSREHGKIIKEEKFWKTLEKEYKRLSDTPNVFVVYYKDDGNKEHEELKRYLLNERYEVSRFDKLGSIPHGPWIFVNLDNMLYDFWDTSKNHLHVF